MKKTVTSCLHRQHTVLDVGGEDRGVLFASKTYDSTIGEENLGIVLASETYVFGCRWGGSWRPACIENIPFYTFASSVRFLIHDRPR